MIRLYLMPKIVIVVGTRNFVQAKYMVPGARSETHYYGEEPHCLYAADVTPEQHTALAANADVAAFPVNLDLRVGAQLPNVQAELEARNLPGEMVTTATTYRKVLRYILAVFSITATEPLFTATVTLNTTLGELTPAVRQELRDAAISSGYSVEGLTLNSTIREALRKVVADAPTRSILGVAI